MLELEKEHDNFHYFATVSREDWDGPRGYVQKFFEDGTLKVNPEVDHVFICGNPSMIDDLQKYLEGCGFTEHSRRNPGNLHLEKYW